MHFHQTLLTILLIVGSVKSWNARFEPEHELIIHMNSRTEVGLVLTGISQDEIKTMEHFMVVSIKKDQKMVDVHKYIPLSEITPDGTWWGTFSIFGSFLGEDDVYVKLKASDEHVSVDSKQKLHVVVIREERLMDKIFTASVAISVSLLYINFGAALDLSALKFIIQKPIGPLIGFVGQFLFMPLISYFLGLILFPTLPEMHLGLFFTGVSPAGGASNMWAVILGGNIDLSITMTAISTFAAFGMIPFWLFSLGTTIFDKANLGVPYSKISTFAFALIIPLAIGLLIQRYKPNWAKLLVRVLKPLSACLIIFIIIFATVANMYLFSLFSWQIITAGLGLPWCGYAFGWILAKICKQSPPDALTIAIETGIQNTGISIFLLRFSLVQPSADLTTVVPVAVAIMTPIPLFAIYLFRKHSQKDPCFIRKRRRRWTRSLNSLSQSSI